MNRRTVLKLGASLGPWRENQVERIFFKVSIHDVAYARQCLYANGLGASAIDP